MYAGQRSVTVTTVVSSTIAFPPSLSSSRIILATSTKLTNSISNRIGASTITSSISNRIGASTITSSVSNRIGVSTITSSISNRIGLSTSSVPSPMSAVTVTREPPHLTPVPTMKPGNYYKYGTLVSVSILCRNGVDTHIVQYKSLQCHVCISCGYGSLSA